MSEEKLQAAKLLECKDKAAKEIGCGHFEYLLQEALKHDSHIKDRANLRKFIDRAMQLYAAQCVKDERERIKKALPELIYSGQNNTDRISKYRALLTEYNISESTSRELFSKGADFFRDRLSQLIERIEI